MEKKKRIFSGVQPSGVLTLGNYLGAIKNWVVLQKEYECIYCIVDLHALTVRQEPKELRQNTKNLMALYLACGLDPEENIIFVQSHVSKHTELQWVLNCYTYFGELNRMTQFKEKSGKHTDNVNAGLFDYPVLMASDILLYQTDLVPVGHDQKQHLEITRDIAERFNNIYPNVFKIPDPYIGKTGNRVMSLQNPENKMSKSDSNINGYISILDDENVIKSKFRKAVTDSGRDIKYDIENKAGVSNLISIYSSLENMSISEVEEKFKNSNYGEFKNEVALSCVKVLKPIQERYYEILKDKKYLEKVMKNGAERAEYLANKTLRKVYKKIGLVPRP